MDNVFHTAELRDSVLVAWRTSPTRLREDAATEADLVRAGYRDRLLTELAQNAADAAAAAGTAGRLAVWLTGNDLHVANAGAPLNEEGVQALSALRASGKNGGDGQAVGQFGVGFTAVRSVADEIDVRSTSGSIRFSAAQTRQALADNNIETTVEPPVLRLPWSIAEAPASGWDTEVVLGLRADVDGQALVADMRAEAIDLLLELPALHSIRVGDVEFSRTETDRGHDLTEVAIADRRWWEFRTPRARWLLPYDGIRPVSATADVLRAPTRSDEELSIPAVLIADVAMQPDRRRLLPDYPESLFTELAAGYADFAAALPAADRLTLVPVSGFPRSEVDAQLRAALLTTLREHKWLPTVAPASPETGSAHGVAEPGRAVVLAGLTDELGALLSEVVPGLLVPALSGQGAAAALNAVGVRRIGLAELAELVGGIDRPARWWGELYAALEPLVVDSLAVEELGAIPVPLTDGRIVTGPRTVLLVDLHEEHPRIDWARVVDPDAVHPLLERLGARRASPSELLSDPALRAELSEQRSDEEAEDLADAVLRLAATVSDSASLPAWLNELELTDSAGERRPADELLLPDAPLAGVLADDAPFSVVAQPLVDAYTPAALRAVGVGWSFAVLTEPDPTDADHDLDDESGWWDALVDEPSVLTAVRDLDLVDETRWPAALVLLAAEPATAALLADRAGYTAWWLRRHARINGVPLGALRHPDDNVLIGLLDAVAHPDANRLRGVLADSAALDEQAVQAVVDALGDPSRHPTPGVIIDAHRLLAAANIDSENIALPTQVRAVTGALLEPEQAIVLDRPWYAAAIDPNRLVVGDIETAPRLAALLDLRRASDVVHAEVRGDGRRTTWDSEPRGALLRASIELPCSDGDLVVHDQLEVCLSGAVEAVVKVQWWVDGTITHITFASV